MIRLAVLTKRELEKSRNELEAFLFTTRDRLESDEFLRFSTASERANIHTELNRASEWYEEQAADSSAQGFIDEKNLLVGVLEPITNRIREANERPKAFAKLQKTVNSTLALIDSFSFLAEKSQNLSFHLHLARLKLSELDAASLSSKNETINLNEIGEHTVDSKVNIAETKETKEKLEKNESQLPLTAPTQLEDNFFSIYVNTEDIDHALSVIGTIKAWQQDAEIRQANTALDRPPAIMSSEIQIKTNQVNTEYSYLVGRVNLWRNEYIRLSRELDAENAKLLQRQRSTDISEQDASSKTPTSDADGPELSEDKIPLLKEPVPSEDETVDNTVIEPTTDALPDKIC